jgi:ribokinase
MDRVKVLQSQVGPTMNGDGKEVCVLGACFLDNVGYVDRMPKPGETLHSNGYAKGFGGKGANQAVMAGRLGGKVRMVSAVGKDGDGASYKQQLAKNGVAHDDVFEVDGESTGLAMIFVDRNTAQNEIVICPNATYKLTPGFLRARTNNYGTFLDKCRILVVQNEIPLETTLDVLRDAHGRGIYTIFNSAPAPSPAEIKVIQPYLRYVSLFCPNETEASLITGIDVKDRQSAIRACRVLQTTYGVRDVVVTLGSQGFLLAASGAASPIHVDGVKVKAVDTTGAGDCFVGAMTFYLQRGLSVLEACTKANVCASISVQRKGTQSSFPFPAELPAGQ